MIIGHLHKCGTEGRFSVERQSPGSSRRDFSILKLCVASFSKPYMCPALRVESKAQLACSSVREDADISMRYAAFLLLLIFK